MGQFREQKLSVQFGCADFCLQKIVLDVGVFSYCRPFLPTKKVPLSRITRVSTKWQTGEGGSYRLFEFRDGETLLCAFNPKLFALADLAVILQEVRVYAPAAEIDEDTAAFLPLSISEDRRGSAAE